MQNKRTLGWFLFGLGGQLQIVASLSFTELFVFIAAPFLFSSERRYMKQNGVLPFFYLSLALVCGCITACLANHTQPTFVLRGMAACCLMPCSIIVSHWMLRNDLDGLKWSFLGGAISGVLCTFVFQKSVEVTMLAGGVDGSNAVADIMSGATYWIHRLGSFITLPARGWYLKCPMLYCVGAPLFMAAYSMLTSISGRGSAARAIASAALVLIGGKKLSSIRNRICRNFWLIVAIGLLGGIGVKQAYQIAATRGVLGEAALAKYEAQTKGNTSIMALLMGGRMESFCGLLACVDNPIIGLGPWAKDDHGYVTEFLAKYGDQEDYARHLQSIAYANAHGIVRLNLIPGHSVVVTFWMWYGIFGLIFCLYVFYALVRYLKQDCWAVPQWYFWIGASIPGTFWDMLFNPLDSRVGLPMMVVACLIVRSVRKGKMPLPYKMIQEIGKAERE